jgi:hypothetical protein
MATVFGAQIGMIPSRYFLLQELHTSGMLAFERLLKG